jgi:transposase
MSKAFPKEFKRDVVAVARKREVPLSQIAKDFGVSVATLYLWLKAADVDDGVKAGVATVEVVALREANKRIKLLQQENEILRRAAA